MANSNRVFVSPGVYTSEKDLTFVAQSVGVTTLGLAGETIQGPAFEPILIRNFDEFKHILDRHHQLNTQMVTLNTSWDT